MRAITAKTRLFAVLGDPVSHSLSPVMHNGWIADAGLDSVYLALRAPDPAALPALLANGLAGANVTVPHKAAAFAAAPPLDALTARIGAANTLVHTLAGLRCANTDGPGFARALAAAAPLPPAPRVLLLGAGGAARGIAFGLVDAAPGARLTITNRTPARAAELAADLATHGACASAAAWPGWAEGPGEGFDLIVNTTSAGMTGQPPLAFPLERAPGRPTVVDIVYAPLETPLLAQARALGLVAVDGLGMLIHQGALAFELWFGIAPDVGRARSRLLAALVS